MLKISIITVCFNAAETIKSTIESIASQNYPIIEHIIVDGGSTDGTREIINKSTSVSKYIFEPDDGIYDAMNKGIKAATGDIVGILNADDFYENENVLSDVAAAFFDPLIDVVYGDLVYVDKENTDKIIRYWKSRCFVPGLFQRGWMPAHPTFFVRKHYFDELGYYDTEYKIQSDFELTMRFLEIYRLTSVYLPNIMIKMRIGGASNNSLRNIIKGNIESFKACKKNNLKIPFYFNLIKTASRLPQFWQRP
ncbi:glycosyltransferase family 2 protein [Methylophaga sulfidovorans]|uniref:Glycosyltransferase involved in cell wall bisynthesis n=1 Tax=Methylophaga sulfidovorans TaxID=45496 RepID=A0A1I3YMT7_9GAMM|nr:glycosyltransferase family 2 protein [Methylophaga sulfidovorans]SFK33178.1 Glycosyltransferase involved in cell wall bisynthesis [Methylophaga sulfidovorans]